ncbi:MAG TPA: hypothetical protein VEX68_19880 [Bryobacteraceae bacterium]|nr:hypothetical protein [Bryobacteraceae bacterium]
MTVLQDSLPDEIYQPWDYKIYPVMGQIHASARQLSTRWLLENEIGEDHF